MAGITILCVWRYRFRKVNQLGDGQQDSARQSEEDEAHYGHRRLRKAETVLRGRIESILLIVEKSHDEHNQTAILRTVEALGIQYVWVVEAPRLKPKKHNVAIARTSVQWLDMRSFESTAECIDAVRKEGRQIWVTDLSQEAECLHVGRGRVPRGGIALVVGSESNGVSQEMLEAADRRIYLPLSGWADSLNLSVATALVLQRVLDDSPHVVGDLREEEKQRLRKKWYLQLAKTDQQKQDFQRFVDEGRVAVPLGDLRRPDEHRENSWVRKKIIRKVELAEQSKLK